MGAVTRDLLSYAVGRSLSETVTLVTLFSILLDDGSANFDKVEVQALARVVVLTQSEINRLLEGGITINEGVSVSIVGELVKIPDQVILADGRLTKVVRFTAEENATVLICDIPPLGNDGTSYGSGYAAAMTAVPQTLFEKYYNINARLNQYLTAQGVRCPVVQFGIDPATMKAVSKDQTNSRYPYLQSHLMAPKGLSNTSREAGIYTRFEYQLSFFTSPDSELENQAALFRPYYLARIAFSDINLKVFLQIDTNTGKTVTVADLLKIREEMNFSMVSGAGVPKAVLIAEMAAVCGYPQSVYPDATLATDIYSGIKLNEDNL